MALPYFAECGWEPLILKVNPTEQEGIKDPTLVLSVPESVKTWEAGAIPKWLTSWTGLRNVGSRSLIQFERLGSQIIQCEKPDLVFFSTTMFQVTILGPIWKYRFGVPYVVDFQDPWRNDYYHSSGVPPPGGNLKYWLSQVLARTLEPQVMRYVSEVIVVSTAYAETLLRRYVWLRPEQFTTLAFGAPQQDFKLLKDLDIQQGIFDRSDGKRHLVYVGAAGPYMSDSLRALFHAIQTARAREPDRWKNVRLHFVGTSYAPQGRAKKTVEPIAEEYGIGDLLDERTDRIPYFEALQLLRDADGLLVIGSDSASYNPSKIFPYILARRPLLAILHHHSPGSNILEQCRAGHVVRFRSDGDESNLNALVSSALSEFMEEINNGVVPNVDWKTFAAYTASTMTQQMGRVFDRAMLSRKAETVLCLP